MRGKAILEKLRAIDLKAPTRSDRPTLQELGNAVRTLHDNQRRLMEQWQELTAAVLEIKAALDTLELNGGT